MHVNQGSVPIVDMSRMLPVKYFHLQTGIKIYTYINLWLYSHMLFFFGVFWFCLVWFGLVFCFLFFVFLFFFFFETGFLCIVLAVLELTLQTRLASNSEIHPPVSASQVLGLKACATTARQAQLLYAMLSKSLLHVFMFAK